MVLIVTNATAADQATVISIGYLMRAIGSGIGVSVDSAVIQTRLKSGLLEGLDLDPQLAYKIADKVKRSLSSIESLPLAYQSSVRYYYGQSIADSMAVMLGSVMTALLFCCLFRRRQFDPAQP